MEKEKREDEKHSKQPKEHCERYCSRICRRKVETIAEVMKRECQQEEQIIEAFEWIRKRGSKENRNSDNSDNFYKGMQYNEGEIRSAEQKKH